MTLTDLLFLRRFEAITPDDNAELNPSIRAIQVAVAGNVVVMDAAGVVTTIYLVAGVWHPMRPTRILVTAPAESESSSSESSSAEPLATTTATGIVGGW